MLPRTASFLLLFTLFYAGPALGAGPADDLGQLLSRLQTLQTDFIQVTVDQQGVNVQQMIGKLWVSRPNLFRWHAEPPFPQEIVSNGKLTWIYDADLEQVIIRKFDPEMAKTPVVLLSGDISSLQSVFTVETRSDGAEQSFILRPRATDTMLVQLILAFREKDLVSINMQDTLGQKTYLQFSASEVNAVIDPQRFEFAIPAGVDVIEDYGDP